MSSAMLLVVLVGLAVAAAVPWLGRPRPRRRHRAGDSPRTRPHRRLGRDDDVVDDAVVLDLVRAALTAGSDVVTAIEQVGTCLPQRQGAGFGRAARSLRLGLTWSQAWPDGGPVAHALAPAWSDGVDPGPLLRHAALTLRGSRQAAAREAAARLGVRLVLPLGLCLLPAFVLLGLVPLLIAAGLDLWAP